MSYINLVKSLLPGDSSESDLEFFQKSYLKAYLRFLKKDETITKFLNNDKCNILADRYLLANSFIYLLKARVNSKKLDYTTFLIALYIAHDIEEDDLALKKGICHWAAIECDEFYKRRKDFLEVLGFDILIEPEVSEQIMSMIDTENSSLWRRVRRESHAGALRYRHESTCDLCQEDRRCDRLRRYYGHFGTFPSDESSSEESDSESFHTCETSLDSWHSGESTGSQEHESTGSQKQ